MAGRLAKATSSIAALPQRGTDVSRRPSPARPTPTGREKVKLFQFHWIGFKTWMLVICECVTTPPGVPSTELMRLDFFFFWCLLLDSDVVPPVGWFTVDWLSDTLRWKGVIPFFVSRRTDPLICSSWICRLCSAIQLEGCADASRYSVTNPRPVRS